VSISQWDLIFYRGHAAQEKNAITAVFTRVVLLTSNSHSLSQTLLRSTLYRLSPQLNRPKLDRFQTPAQPAKSTALFYA